MLTAMPDPTGRGDRSRDAAQVRAIRAGDATAFGDLFDRWFDRVYDVARNVLHDDHAAADVAQDTFLAAWQQLDRLADPASFGGWVLRIGRNRALDRLRQAQRTRPLEDEALNAVHDGRGSSVGGTAAPPDPADVVAAVDRDDLVRVAVLALGPRDASLVDLQMRHGLTPAEIAEELGVTPNAAHQQLFRMRERLGTAIGSLLLWRRGRPACPQLASVLGGAATFDAAMLGVIDRHGRGCASCTEARASMTSPQQLFAAIPIAVVPVAIRADVVTRLAGNGVPTDPVVTEGPAVDPSSTGHGTARRAVRRMATRRAAVLSGTVGVVAAVTVGLVVLARDDPGPRAATPVSSAASTQGSPTTAAETTEPATTETPTTARATTTERVTTTDAPTTTSGPTTTLRPTTTSAPTTVVVAAPVPTSTEAPRSGDKDTDDLTPTQGGADPKRPEQGSSDTTDVPDTSDPTVETAPPSVAPTSAPTGPSVTVPPTATIASTTTTPTTAPPPPVPSTTVPPQTVPSTTVPPAPVVVTGFTVAPGSNSLICAVPAQSPRRFQWTSMGATSATLTIAGTPRSVPLSGPYDACAASGAMATIAVSGPGGDDSRSLVVP
jgi:RNA polymerase sigma factor (sigma-70 family)